MAGNRWNAGASKASAAPTPEGASKRLEKLLRQIEALEEKQKNGEQLDEEQLAKLAKKSSAEAELKGGAGFDKDVPGEPAPSLLAEIQGMLASIPNDLIIALDSASEKRCRTLQRQLRETEKLMKIPTLDKLQQPKLERLQEEAPEILKQLRPLNDLLLAMASEGHDIAQLKAERTAANGARSSAEAASAIAQTAAEEREATERERGAPSIGIDVGGVLSRFRNDIGSDDTWHLETASAVDGSMEALRLLVRKFGSQNVHIVSKCSGRMRAQSEAWLFKTMDICKTCGIRKTNVHFCPERSGAHGKGPIASFVRLSHFVDDNDECLWSVYHDPAGNSKEAIENHNGKLYHFSRSGKEDVCRTFAKTGRCPYGDSCKFPHDGPARFVPRNWRDGEVPDCVVRAGNWADVLRDLEIDTSRMISD